MPRARAAGVREGSGEETAGRRGASVPRPRPTYGDLRSAPERMPSGRRHRRVKRGREFAVEERGWTMVEVDGDCAAPDPTRRSGHWGELPLRRSIAVAAVGGI